jgi:tetratricopeptide (TPR) repeat protein
LNKAEQNFEASLKIISSFSDAMYGLGTVLWEKDEVDRALTQFDRVVDFNPGHAAALLSRSIIRSDRHQYREALQDSTQSLKLYDRELAVVAKSIADATKRGQVGRADAERKKKDRIDVAMKRAQEIKAAAETQSNN